VEKAAIVLIVDDEVVLLRSMSRSLQSEHYDIVTSFTAAGALKAIIDLGDRVRLLITDLSLPDKDGRELVREAEALNPRLRTLFITGWAAPKGEEHRTVLKPFSSLALRLRILEELRLSLPGRP
jgi:two-component system cell cycle sensor histidine kinase/response regulator CckA